MPNADAVTISSYAERKAAVLRAAQLLSSGKGSEEDVEFAALTDAIVDFDIGEEAQAYIEIPPAFVQFLTRGYRRPAAERRR